MSRSQPALRHALALLILAVAAPALGAQTPPAQPVDTAYTRLIHESLRDARITTELVDHLPASSTVPTPLDFNGRIVGAPGELTYAADIHRYLRAIAAASPRATVFSIGTTEEGREMVVMAIADSATIADLERYKGYLHELTDPRATSDQRAQQLIHGVAKPIYWFTSGMHSPETGGPEMLQELAYRLVVEETPFIQDIRDNVITFITPVIEVDGREKEVDTYYFNKARPQGASRLPLMYWGRYVAHDNNRDGMGQFLDLTKNVNATWLEWTPTIMHDLHEAQSYLYTSTGTGPYNEAFDPITIDEWWLMAENDIVEMTKRGVPGVWTYGFYDGWTPNYMFTIAHAHNGIGRFYEVQSYGPDPRTVRLPPTTTSREWFRPNPPLPSIEWGPRNNTNIQESAALFSLKYVADHRDWFLDNYWLKNQRAVAKGKEGPVNAWVIPAGQRRRADAVDAVNELMRQGLEVHRADRAFEVGGVKVARGDFVVRGDQPYRTIGDMYFSLQRFSLDNPQPYDDTGWTFQLERDIELDEVKDASVLQQPMTPVTYPARAEGGVTGRGKVLVVDHTADNNLMLFRFKNARTRMLAAEKDFDLAGHHFTAGAFIVPDGNRDALEADLSGLGLSAWATDAVPDVPAHDLDVPRIGYVHSWQRTQDEGWVRAALDTYGVPYDYIADQDLRKGGLRRKYDVILFPHVGGDALSQVNGIPKSDSIPLPYEKSERFTHLGMLDSSPDIRGGMGLDGLMELDRFVQDGGTLIVEGSTSNIFPTFGITQGVSVEDPSGLEAPGSVHRGVVADSTSPILYGYVGKDLPVYYRGDVVLSAGGAAGRLARLFQGGGGSTTWQNTTPMANQPRLSPWQPDDSAAARSGRGGQDDAQMAQFREMARAFGLNVDQAGPRVVVKFPDDASRMLLSGALGGGEALEGTAQVVDAPVGRGHVVMFAIRPFWRWQTQGTFFLGFNAILNWNDLGAGAAARAAEPGGR